MLVLTSKQLVETAVQRTKCRRLELRIFTAIFALKILALFLWIYVIYPLHLDHSWPTAVTFITSAPLFYRFVDGPTATISSMLIFIEGVVANCLLWAWLLAWVKVKLTRSTEWRWKRRRDSGHWKFARDLWGRSS